MGGKAGDRPAGSSHWLTTQASVHAAAIGWLASLGHAGASRCHLSGRAARTACTLSSTSALAQLRLGVAVTNAEALRDLVTDGRRRDLQLFYFTSGTYSPTALAYADRFDIALFTYDRAGIVRHANTAAMTAILDAPDGAALPEEPHPTLADSPTGGGRSTAHDPDLHVWAASAWRARQTPGVRSAFLAYLPLAVSLLVGLLALTVVRAWLRGAESIPVQALVAAALVFHACCVWGALRVARWRGQLREHGLHVMQACTPPGRARAVVEAAMQRSGRGVPHDREAFVLLRNEVMALSGVDAFTAGVLVWETTIGATRPTDRKDWLGLPHGGRPGAY